MRIVFLFAALLAMPLRAEIVDRIVAVVDGHVITLSAALSEANYQAFRAGEPPVVKLSGDSLRKVVSQMIDQSLLENERENSPFFPTDNGETQRTLAAIHKRYPKAEDYERALARYRLTVADLVQHVSRESSILAFIDYHLRPEVHLAPDAVETYYNRTLLPEMRRERQSEIPPLNQVSGQIEEILIQREMNRLLEDWLQELRHRAAIRMLLES